MRACRLISLFLLGVWTIAVAADPADPPPPRPLVFFFGGHGATFDDMTAWVVAATTKCGGTFDFMAMGFPPDAGSDFGNPTGTKDGKEIVKKSSKLLNDKYKNQKIIIVGHSSGLAVANATARAVDDPQRIMKIISLDGGNPASIPGVPTDHYSTDNWSNQPYSKIFKGCQPGMCRHFRFVDLNSDPLLMGGDSARDEEHGYYLNGYKNLTAKSINLDWLNSQCVARKLKTGPPQQKKAETDEPVTAS